MRHASWVMRRPLRLVYGVGFGPINLRVMQIDEYARATVRLSVGPSTTADQVDRAAAILIDQVRKQQHYAVLESDPLVALDS